MRALGVISGLLLCSCSLIFVEGPPDFPDPSETPRCESGRGWVIVDAAFAAMNFAALAFVDDVSDSAVGVVGGLGWSVIHIASAAAGMSRTKRCREAYAAHDEWQAAGFDAPEAAAARVERDYEKYRPVRTPLPEGVSPNDVLDTAVTVLDRSALAPVRDAGRHVVTSKWEVVAEADSGDVLRHRWRITVSTEAIVVEIDCEKTDASFVTKDCGRALDRHRSFTERSRALLRSIRDEAITLSKQRGGDVDADVDAGVPSAVSPDTDAGVSQ